VGEAAVAVAARLGARLGRCETATVPTLRLRRVHDPPGPEDGLCVRVDRLWPRAVSRASGRVALWLKDLAPSDARRREFHGKPEAWDAFRAAYAEELKAPAAQAALAALRQAMAAGPVPLLFAARDEARNNAAALAELL
jgi:uncharacterized protein YeaO (DUF488 family)